MTAECPYCLTYQEICHDDGYGLDEGQVYEQGCSNCGRIFGFEVMHSIDYYTRRLPCANKKPHKWVTRPSFPAKERSKVECVWCRATRQLTDEEWMAVMDPMEALSWRT